MARASAYAMNAFQHRGAYILGLAFLVPLR